MYIYVYIYILVLQTIITMCLGRWYAVCSIFEFEALPHLIPKVSALVYFLYKVTIQDF